jgi:hypothetical protein
MSYICDVCRTHPADFLIEYLVPLKDFDLKGDYSNAAGLSRPEQQRKRISVCGKCREETDFDEFFKGKR